MVGATELIVILAMVAINSLFAGYEIALASVSMARLQLLLRENRAGSRAALYMKQNMERSLAAVQVGITLVGAVAAATGGASAQESITPILQRSIGISEPMAEWLAIALVVVPLTVCTILFGELVPKVLAIRNKEWFCLRMSPVMRCFTFSVWPAVWLFEHAVMALVNLGERIWWYGREAPRRLEAAELLELRAQAAEARASRLIGEREEGIIVGAARLSSRPIREIMLPADDISMLDINGSLADSLIAAHLDMHTRFPVAQRPGDPQSIVGYVNFKDIVALMRLSQPQSPSLHAIVRALPNLDAESPIATSLEHLIREHTHIALLRDCQGKVVGMITLEDILEELVGDIQDEYDRLPAHLVPSGPAWVAGGGIALPRLKEIAGFDLSADLPPCGARTLTDWITGHLGHAVHGGDTLRRDGVRVVIRKVRRQKVLEAQVVAETGPAGRNGKAELPSR